MSQGYSYAPPTLDEAIRSYQRAKEKAKLVEKYSKDVKIKSKVSNKGGQNNEENMWKEPHSKHKLRLRRRGYSQGSISELQNSDYTDLDLSEDDYSKKWEAKRKYHNKNRLSKPRNLRQNALIPHHSVPAWSQAYPGNSYYQYAPFVPTFANGPSQFPIHQNGLPGHYMMLNVPYFYPQPPIPHGIPNYPHAYQNPYTTQYNVQPAEPMNMRDFQRDCKYSPAPSRPYSDSDLLETLSKRSFQDSDRFSVIPPIKRMNRSDAAKVIQRGYRGYKNRVKSSTIREKFYIDFVDKLIDDLLVEELLPDILVEVLLYGVKDVKLPTASDRAVAECADHILDECVYDLLRSAANSVFSEILTVYAGKRADNDKCDILQYVVDELIALQIREVVQEFLREYILDFQCERVYNQLVYETTSVLVCEVMKEEFPEAEQVEQTPPKKTKPPFDLDNIILASVLCKSLVPNEDYILDGVIAQGLANQLKLDSGSSGKSML